MSAPEMDLPPNPHGEAVSLHGLPEQALVSRALQERVQPGLKGDAIALSVYQSMAQGVVVTDADLTVLAANPSFQRLTGYAEHELLGRSVALAAPETMHESRTRSLLEELQRGGVWQAELMERRRNGERYVASVSIHPMPDEGGATTRRMAFFEEVTERRRVEAEIWERANYDEVTGLPNRYLFRDRLDQGLRMQERSGLPLALFFLDLDHFKVVNDTHGHELGDRLLSEAGARISACVRATDTAGRLGGDEFTVVMSELTETGRVRQVAEEVVARLKEPFLLEGRQIHISASMGIALSPRDGTRATDLLRCADRAMYAAKREGGCGYRYFR